MRKTAALRYFDEWMMEGVKEEKLHRCAIGFYKIGILDSERLS
jgi:hypothetical protein